LVESAAVLLCVALLGAVWWLRSWHYRQQARRQLLAQSKPEFAASPRRSYAVPYQRAIWYQPLLIAVTVSAAAVVLHWKMPVVFSLACLAGAVATMLLGLWKERRNGLMESQLADAIDLIIGAVRAGSSSTVALEAAAKTARQPLRSELDTV
jgi:Flp pilus assembly protein TadB